MSTSKLIRAEELLGKLGASDLRLIDASFELTEPEWGAAQYAKGHIPGAVHLDLDLDLSSTPQRHGGRHPLPDMRELTGKLGELGIGPEHQVVVYDQEGTMYAARAWWLLEYAGHANVKFLDGGLAAYLAAGGELTQAVPHYPPTTFPLKLQSHMAVDFAHVGNASLNGGAVIVDARAGERYRGEVEPLDPKAGHIPGAINRPYEAMMNGGHFLPPGELAERFAVLEGEDEVIAYCGSGVSGAHLVLAMHEAGYPGAKLYAGSWSDWSSYDDLPVATGEEPH